MRNAILALATLAVLGIPAHAQAVVYPWTVGITFDPNLPANYPSAQTSTFGSSATFGNVTEIQTNFDLGPRLLILDLLPIKAPSNMSVAFERDWDGEALLNALLGLTPGSGMLPTTVAISSNISGAPANQMMFQQPEFTAWELYAEQGDVFTVREQSTFTYGHRQVQFIPSGPQPVL
jgi:hypothetical protein